ncbi:MAG: sigma-70 family RNA polymerase sigma factor [Polyangiaceae bacterium]|nr:sigma-70 family RNA polymerase sigma factor [Polyangiaceae bacterium]
MPTAPPASTPRMTVGSSSPPDFDEVYQAHIAFVVRSLRRLGLPEAQIADAAQEIFIIVYRQLPSFQARSSLKTWIFGIVYRVAVHWGRQHQRRKTSALPAEFPDRDATGPMERAARSEDVQLLYRILAGLSEEQRAVFILAELEQMKVPEIAQAVSANVHTVASRLKTARRRFEALLRRQRTLERWRQP